MDPLDNMIGALRKAGHRITKGRKNILRELLKIEEPIAALDMHKRCRKSEKIDKVTVYREFAFLSSIGMVHCMTFSSDGIKRYQLAPAHGHKHHLVCTACKTVKNVQMGCEDLHAIEQKISKEKNFSIQNHTLEFYGLCAKCA